MSEPRSPLPFAACWATAAALTALTGCSYTSAYVPPADGRARVLWEDQGVVASLPGASIACSEATSAVAGGGARRAYDPGGPTVVYVRPSIVYWIPIVHETRAPAPIHVSVGPTPGVRQVASPSVHTHSGSPRAPSGGGTATKASSGSSSSSSSNAAGLGALTAVAVVAALVVLPVITFSVAFSRPGPDDDNASAIDRINAYNDLARTPGSPCATPDAEEGAVP